MNTDQITKIFGSPISLREKLPFEWNKTNRILALIGTGLAIYGFYHVCSDIRKWNENRISLYLAAKKATNKK